MSRIPSHICFLFLSLLQFTSCVLPTQEDEIKEMIVGKWKEYSTDDILTLTDDRYVHTYYADGSRAETTFSDGKWQCLVDGEYVVADRMVLYDGVHYGAVATVSSISGQELVYKDIQYTDGRQFSHRVFHRVNADFSKLIIGLWEGVEMSGQQTYGDINHRWRYNSDGSYIYYSKDDSGNWIPSGEDEQSMYFVDGDYFCSRWIKGDSEQREWWDIDSCSDIEMVWSALRKDLDGNLFMTTFRLRRVSD